MGEVEIAGFKVKPGEIKTGSIKLVELSDGTPISLPLITMNGIENGPTLLLTAVAHGTEIAGIETIRRLLREELKPQALKGAVIAIPLLNPLAFNASSYLTPNDNIDLTAAFPGSPNGTTSKRMAYAIWKIIKKANHYIDLHCMPGRSIPLTVMRSNGVVKDDVSAKAMEMANAFGLTITQPSPETLRRRPATLIGVAMQQGIPSIVGEMSGWYSWSRPVAEVGVKGVLNVMKHLGMIEGRIEKHQGVPVLQGPLYTHLITADKGGIVHTLLEPAAAVSQGDLIAKIYNIYGDLIEECRSPMKGYLITYPFQMNPAQAVATGDWVAMIGYKS